MEEEYKSETEEDGKDYQMRWRISCGKHQTPDKGNKRRREAQITGQTGGTEIIRNWLFPMILVAVEIWSVFNMSCSLSLISS